MREIRLSGSEGGGTESNRFSLPLSKVPPVHLSTVDHPGAAAAQVRRSSHNRGVGAAMALAAS